MDRALDLATLTAAVGGGHLRLPEPVELQRLLADTEIRLFTQQASIDERLLDTGWYLQAVATARPDLQLYDLPRQRLAHQVSGHIFDLALQSVELSETERLRYTFAAQVGYLGGELTPNASALARRAPLPSPPYDWSEPGRMSLEAGVLVLALDRSALYPLLRARKSQLDALRAGPDEIATTPYAAVDGVIRGAWALTNYLTYGRPDYLEQALGFLTAALATEAAAADVDSRWVAAHLIRLIDGLRSTSVWAVIPPDYPGAARAMTSGDPPVLTLWPPQLAFLAGDQDHPSPFDPTTRRLVLSFPTSAGKTLLAQILIAVQVASTDGDVCVVAPTHSLCREISISLDRRLRTLGYQLHQEGPVGFALPPKPAAARVSVMTPEKLATMLRSDPAELLARYSMFVIDEAHLVADGQRGWRLEETLSFLHHLTRDTDHRILVLSAALGSQIHIVQWMETEPGGVVQRHEDWRGPRRLNAIYTTEPSWDDETVEPGVGQRLARRHIPLHGLVHLSTGDLTVQGRFDESVGTLVQRQTRTGAWTKDDKATTRQREYLVPLINHVATSGPVLVVQATRAEAQRQAVAVAESLEAEPSTFALADLTRTRLGEGHPLTEMVTKGVAFHHAALPVDIQTEIEDAVRAGQIRILIATSTLTEGVNLPFKTVIVGRRGYPTAQGEVELIDDAGLLNAVGRAGRAGRETEGWVILTKQQRFEPEMFEELERTGDDLDIRSTLTTEAALAGVIAFETAARTAEDAIFAYYEPATDGFLSFVWFIAQSLEDLRGAAPLDDVNAAVQSTLAWQQLEPEQQDALLAATRASLEAFHGQDPAQRARWSRSGTSLPTASTLDDLAQALFARITPEVDLTDTVAAIDFILADGVMDGLLALRENERRGFKPYRTAPRTETVPVDLKALLLDWVSGVELQDLADRHLTAIDDEGYRYEQLAEFSASVFEHHLPWTLGVVIGWVNSRLENTETDVRLPEYLPGAIHYGVSTKSALSLMTGGVRSRRLANAVARHAIARTDPEQTLREWLGAFEDHAEWSALFDASPTELSDLLSYARAPGAQVVSQILEGSPLELPITAPIGAVTEATDARLVPHPDASPPAPIEIVADDVVVGTIKPRDHDDVALLTSMGIPLTVTVAPGVANPVVSIALAPEPDLDA